MIHVVWHGVDVAESLRQRAEWAQASGTRFQARRAALYWLWPKRGDLNRFLACMPLERGFALWESYVRQARAYVQMLGDRACEVRYEEVLADPVPALRSLVRFCDLAATDDDIVRAAGDTRPERAYAYQASATLQQFALRMAPRLQAVGYAPLLAPSGHRRRAPGP